MSVALDSTSSFPADWISPEEQLERLHPYSQSMILTILPVTDVARLVTEYVNNLGRNGTNWYTALKRLDALPPNIPSLPPNTQEILHLPCPVFGDQLKEDGTFHTINDTHSLYLIPAGHFETLIPLYSDLRKIFYINNIQTALFNINDSQTLSKMLHSPKTEWVIVLNRLLPDSCNRTYNEQVKMITELRKKTFINYERPAFKYVFAANILDRIAKNEEKGFWLTENENRGETRVLEPLPSHSASAAQSDKTMTVGNFRPRIGASFAYIEEVPTTIGFPTVGIAPIWIGFSPKPPEEPLATKCCAIS